RVPALALLAARVHALAIGPSIAPGECAVAGAASGIFPLGLARQSRPVRRAVADRLRMRDAVDGVPLAIGLAGVAHGPVQRDGRAVAGFARLRSEVRLVMRRRAVAARGAGVILSDGDLATVEAEPAEGDPMCRSR